MDEEDSGGDPFAQRPAKHLAAAVSGLDLDDVGKYAAVAAVVCYAIGLVTVNAYLFQIGVSDFAVLRTRFILTGLLVLLSLFFLAFIVTSFAILIPHARGKSSLFKKDDRKIVGTLVRILPLASFVPLCLLTVMLIARKASFHATIPIEILAILSSLIVPTMFLVVMNEDDDSLNDQPIFSAIIGSVIVILSISSTITFIDFFAGTIYPIVPKQFGGGSPQEVRLVVSKDGNMTLGTNGMDIMETEIISKPLDLLWETDQMYVVRFAGDADARILQVDKDSVVGVIGEPQFSGFSFFGLVETTPVATPEATPVATP